MASSVVDRVSCTMKLRARPYSFALVAWLYLCFSSFFNSDRLILPLMVFGRNSGGTNSIFLGYLYGAAFRLQKSCSSAVRALFLLSDPAIACAAAAVRTIKALITSSRWGSGEATTADSTTLGWSLRVDSTSKGPVAERRGHQQVFVVDDKSNTYTG